MNHKLFQCSATFAFAVLYKDLVAVLQPLSLCDLARAWHETSGTAALYLTFPLFDPLVFPLTFGVSMQMGPLCTALQL